MLQTTATRSTGRRLAIGLAVAPIAILAACGGDDATDDATATQVAGAATTAAASTDSASSATTDAAVVDSPVEIGDQIATLYLAAYDDVIATLADRPDPAEATSRLSELKEGYIQQLVELGRRREALDASGRATVDARVSSALMGLPADTLAAYQAAIDDYAADTELNELIRSFNIIGQYASFDLLREQEPEEAARLGID